MPSQRYERVCQPQSPLASYAPRNIERQETPRDTLQDTNSIQIAGHDEDEDSPITSSRSPYPIPNSPPPSFHSRASSPSGGANRRLLSDDPLHNDTDRTLADTFDSPSDEEDSDDEDGDGMDDRQRLMRGQPDTSAHDEDSTPAPRQGVQRRVTQLPVFNTQAPTPGRIYGGGQNDGVWANLSAKPTRGEDVEEKPPVCIGFEPETKELC